MGRPDRKTLLWGLVLGACWAVSTIAGAAWFRIPLDLYQTLLVPRPTEGQPPPSARPLAQSRVVLVDVSVDSGEGSPIVPRATLSRVLRKVSELGAWSIGFDVLFEEHKDPRIDRELETAIRESGRVVLATRYDSQSKSLPEIQPVFAGAAACLGLANVIVDSHDGYIRMVQHYYDAPGIRSHYSLSLQMARLVLASGTRDLPGVTLAPAGLSVKASGGGGVHVSFDRHGMSLIQYLGPAGTIPQIRWNDLLGCDRKKLDLTGRAVLIGDTRLVTRDAYLTPFHRGAMSRISGVEVHAQNLLGLLSGFRREMAGPALDWATGLAGVGLGYGLTRWLPLPAALPSVPVLIALAWFAGHLSFAEMNVFVNPLPATIGLLLAWLAVLAALAGGRKLPTEAADAKAVARAVELVEQGQPGLAIERLQPLLPVDGQEPSPHVRWGLALAFLAKGDVALALPHVESLQSDALPLEHVYRLALALLETGALCEAEGQFRRVLARNVAYKEAAKHAQALAERDPQVPDTLRRALVHRYQDLSFVASGGMGRIYRAYDRVRREQVAIKVPDPELLKEADARRRFRREIDTLTKLDHPHIVRLHDVGPEELPYYAMELLGGQTLEELIRRELRLKVAPALRILGPIASALAASHREGIIHRDLKPANILLDEKGRPRLTDFGLAHLEDTTRLTKMSVNVGTPAYMAPEQLESAEPGPPMDVYAFGVVFYEALCGQLPYRSENALSKLIEVPVPLRERLGTVPANVESLVMDCLARDPADRPRNGDELVNRLRAAGWSPEG